MSKKIWVAMRRSAFIVLLVGSVIWLGYCMKPRDGTNPEFSNTVTFREFYELKPFERIRTEKVDMHPVMENYLIRIAQLCEEKGIHLVLTKTPTITHFLERHNAIRAFAEEYGVDFIDFNESEVYYNGLDYWFETDNSDAEHTNYWGSAKVMDYLGEFFVNTYDLEAHEDSQWSDLETRYQEWIETGEESALSME